MAEGRPSGQTWQIFARGNHGQSGARSQYQSEQQEVTVLEAGISYLGAFWNTDRSYVSPSHFIIGGAEK